MYVQCVCTVCMYSVYVQCVCAVSMCSVYVKEHTGVFCLFIHLRLKEETQQTLCEACDFIFYLCLQHDLFELRKLKLKNLLTHTHTRGAASPVPSGSTQLVLVVVVVQLRTSSVPVGAADHEAHVVHLPVSHQALGQLRSAPCGDTTQLVNVCRSIIQEMRVGSFHLPSNLVESDWLVLVAGASSPPSSSSSCVPSRLCPPPMVAGAFSESTAPPQDTAGENVVPGKALNHRCQTLACRPIHNHFRYLQFELMNSRGRGVLCYQLIKRKQTFFFFLKRCILQDIFSFKGLCRFDSTVGAN